ncbi:HNH endonuclease [Peribacillus sp. NPDC097198]|uniref:HNH endonuclease n=1 Tax=Peribacillus sp. NPDC097198 TaxID=3364397 RepID=UPI00380DF421
MASGTKLIPYSKEFVQNQVQKAQGSIKDMGKALGKVEVPTGVKVRTVADTTGNTYKSIGVDKTTIKDLAQKITAKGEGSKGTGNNRQIDYTRGFDVEPKYSSYEQRVKTTPINKGEWSNERAESLFISDKTGEIKKYLDEAGVDGVDYKNGMPDFSPFSKGEIKLENMTNDRKSNFSTADEELAKKWSTPDQKWTAEDIADWREDNKYTWHELNDLETIQLVPSKINSVFKHLGGVGEYNIKVKLGE